MKKIKVNIEETQLFGLIRTILYITMIVLEVFIIVAKLEYWIPLLVIELILSINDAVKYWGLKKYKHKIICYIIDFIALVALTCLTGSNLMCVMFIIILTEFYLSTEIFVSNIVMFAFSVLAYLISYAVATVRIGEGIDVIQIISNCFSELLFLIFHFIIVNFSVTSFRDNKIINQQLKDLDESKKKLQQAYNELAEITALEERQRIAKDIHDTAGHSITTVIMQTEAAKLTIDKDPEGAKSKIIAANLQAKHALDELRASVHLLSGQKEHITVKDELENIIHDSCDGTGINIRSEIDEVTVSDTKRRFICNTLKEGISNGLRHGKATAFYFELKENQKESFLSFLLSDNGTGVKKEGLKEGFGLSGMRDRVKSLGGKIKFISEPEEGFEIHIDLPCDNQNQNE